MLTFATAFCIVGCAHGFAGARGTQPPMPEPTWISGIRHDVKPSQTWWHGRDVHDLINPRSSFVRDLIGMYEGDFRTRSRWSPENPFNPNNVHSRTGSWVSDFKDRDGNYRRATIFQGTFDCQTLGDLNRRLVARGSRPLAQRPFFSIIVYDPYTPWQSDVNYLQALPENKGAAFQLASTLFGPLEGGIANRAAGIGDMFPHAAQGEEASVSAAGATFWRKYCLGRPRYLLSAFGDRFKVIDTHGGPALAHDQIAHYTYQPGDEEKVAVAIHDNIAVTSGYGDRHDTEPGGRGSGAQQRLKVYTHIDAKGDIAVDTARTQMISQILTSSFCLRDFSIITPGAVQASRMLLRALYEATLKIAVLYARPRIFLTMVGASAFANDVRWVGEALLRQPFIDTITSNNLQVTLIYHPSPRIARRNATDDYAFFGNALRVFDAVNGTQYADDHNILECVRRYLNEAYTRHNNEREIHEAAADLNDLLMKDVIWSELHGPRTPFAPSAVPIVPAATPMITPTRTPAPSPRTPARPPTGIFRSTGHSSNHAPETRTVRHPATTPSRKPTVVAPTATSRAGSASSRTTRPTRTAAPRAAHLARTPAKTSPAGPRKIAVPSRVSPVRARTHQPLKPSGAATKTANTRTPNPPARARSSGTAPHAKATTRTAGGRGARRPHQHTPQHHAKR